MGTQLSRDMVLKQGDGESTEVFTAVAAMTSKSFSLGGEAIDVTSDDSKSVADATKLVRELMAGGVQTLDISGDFRATDDASHAALVTAKMDGNPIGNWQIVVPGLGTFEGPFDLSSLDFSGDDSGGDLTGSLALRSAGDFTFTAV